MTGWPDGIDAWDPAVTDRDIGIARHTGSTVCLGCRQERGTAHAPALSGDICWRLRARQETRMTYIAWLHVKGGHPLTDPAVAARALEWRDALIGDMRDHDVLDRDMFAAAAARLRPTIDETARGLAAFAHLDQGWDGTGVRPSSLAALTASIGRDQG